ncbi:23S rRNA (guanosine(2251)-2'-O)-methyltransferase RlmB [Patescibacteria group bacterium]|nr:23S rRNA (guanosine(2251)-2'-O)-methyltransferase RlmB [Patescibacteria group bacterium]
MKKDIKKESTIIYGFHPIESAATNDAKNIMEVWIDKNRKDKRVQKITELLRKNQIKIKLVPRDFLDKEAGHKKHQGIVARYRQNNSFNEVDLFEILEKENVFLLILDGIQDPHNLGAILRTASAGGVDAVIAPKDRAVGITPVVRKIASSGTEKTPFIQVTNLAQTLRKLQENDIWCIGTAGETEHSIYDQDFKGKIAVVMGSEDKGLRRLTRENCDSLAKIPMKGEIESLNVSVATGIVLFEAIRQRGL